MYYVCNVHILCKNKLLTRTPLELNSKLFSGIIKPQYIATDPNHENPMKTPIFCKDKLKKLWNHKYITQVFICFNSNDNFRIESVILLGRSSLKKLLDGGRDSGRTLLIQKCTDDAVLFAIFLMKQLLFDIFRLKPDKCVEMVHFWALS